MQIIQKNKKLKEELICMSIRRIHLLDILLFHPKKESNMNSKLEKFNIPLNLAISKMI